MAFQTHSAVKTGMGSINAHGTSLCLFRQVAIRVEPNRKSVITVENIINSRDKHMQLIIDGYSWLGANRSHIIRINRPEIVFQIAPSVTDHNSVITLKEQTGNSGAALSGACPAPHGLSESWCFSSFNTSSARRVWPDNSWLLTSTFQPSIFWTV